MTRLKKLLFTFILMLSVVILSNSIISRDLAKSTSLSNKPINIAELRIVDPPPEPSSVLI